MNRTCRLPGALALLAILLPVVPVAHGQLLPDADTREVQNGVRLQDCDDDTNEEAGD